ncbi:uncharacterized protein TNCV_1340941 [Trichonephila clavipes]|uniref:Uncharacterized protein n=1 Tax=Trichonephila clavipes TaxID=2585209 RepID=A0A8X6RSY6_TRICX|nr:uncharacterized protein TNCV_1340941 [Trichonephila clavipes]
MDCILQPKCINCSQSHASDSKFCPKWKIEKQIQEIKTNKNISYSEACKLIVPQISQTYVQVTKPLPISTSTQTDPNLTNIICPPLQCLKSLFSEKQMSSKSSLMPVASTSSSTQVQLFSSASPIIPSIPCESQPPILNSNASTDNSSHTWVPTLPSEDFILPSTSDRVENLSTEIQPPVPLLDTSPTTSSSQPFFLKVVNKNSKRKRKRMKEQKSDIEIKMSPHKPNKSYVHYISEDEDMIVYDVEEDESLKHIIQDGYSHFMTPSKYKKK